MNKTEIRDEWEKRIVDYKISDLSKSIYFEHPPNVDTRDKNI
ncbi:hypothetical protein [Fonticella tunisiensis]|uniref:Uncharacterized protein n=1 Tax=Fonticella tunisiensis TaxID=1096341 RepID=A0A4R7KNU7_9CLOT|nr:hypothetical protein [Fonticella tunisiensis]TDT58370.1 hypothetical protein EDD71_1113 [Fonticella tunisiensis]